ncbi:3-dehydroquinate synthase [Brachyspira sp. CAG:484]|nr:3-dehydroquinate synthase [Brachyspira sp. CAG:484]
MADLSVNINSSSKSYPIIINNEDISGLHKKILSYTSGKKFLVIISEKVNKLYGKVLGFDKSEKFVMKDGEKEKNFKNYQKILNHALKMQLTRGDSIIAVGGGVVGDIAGFAASTYMRGINFIQVPTTLLACVDSSVGGKTGIDTDFGKNLVGSFYQPKVVLINTNFLKTLDDRQFKTGLGEVVKYAFIEKSCRCEEELNLTNFISENVEKILSRQPKTLEQLIEICIKLKVSVVQKDEKEGGLRKILNFGHTYGHAVEKYTNYKKFTHGEAIVKGMIFAFDMAVKRNLIDENYKYFADDVIKKFNFKKIQDYPIEKMVRLMKMDKKADSDYITFILPVDYSVVEEFKLTENDFL